MNPKFFVDFYDSFDGWGTNPKIFPNRLFSDLAKAKEKCKSLQSKLSDQNKKLGEHYSVIDLEKGRVVWGAGTLKF